MHMYLNKTKHFYTNLDFIGYLNESVMNVSPFTYAFSYLVMNDLICSDQLSTDYESFTIL